MRGVRRTEQGIEVVDLPEPKGDGVRIHVRSVGICQTDVNLAKLGPMPVTLGHEFAGELDDGTPVGVEPMIPQRMPLDAAPEAFALIEGATPSIKVVLEP